MKPAILTAVRHDRPAAALTLMEELPSISMEPKRAAAAADAPAAKRVP